MFQIVENVGGQSFMQLLLCFVAIKTAMAG
jgi:hypothetical protein